MSLCNSHLIDLPWLAFRQVVDELVDALGLRKVLILRLVNVRFDHEVLSVILARQLTAERKGIPFPYIRRPVMSRLLLKRVEDPSVDENQLISKIRRTAGLINDTYHQNGDAPPQDILHTLCTGAVTHLGSLRTAKLMVSESEEWNQANYDLDDLLTATAMFSSLKPFEYVFSKCSNANSVSEYFGTPLQVAAAQGNYEMVLLLLEQGADANYVGGDDVLFQREAFRNEGTALRSASKRDHKVIARLLLEPLYKLKTSGACYENAIMDAAHAGHTDMVTLLLERGTFTNKLNLQYEILWTASSFGYYRLVQTMLNEGLEVNATQLGGSRALESAAFNGHVPVVSLLFERGANLKYVGNQLPAIHAAASNGHEELVQIFLDKGVDINYSGSRGLTPLWEAAKSQQLSMMRFLLAKGADLEADECGEYAFFRAVIQGHEDVVRILAEAGVNVDGVPDDSEPPPIVNAMMHGQTKMVKVLLELGARNVDPLKSAWAGKFLDGTYPLPPSPQPLLSE